MNENNVTLKIGITSLFILPIATRNIIIYVILDLRHSMIFEKYDILTSNSLIK